MRRRFLTSLYGQVLLATAIGLVVGHMWPSAGAAMKPLADGFIKLVRMIVAPIIFCTVVAGIAGASGVKTVGKAGALALVYFEIVTTIALLIGLLVVNLAQPGAAMHVDPSSLDASAVAPYVAAGKASTGTALVLDIIPTTIADAFARGDLLQVLLVSILFGVALKKIGAPAAPLFTFVEALSRVLFAIVGIIMKTAPIGAFGAMAFTIGTFGIGALTSLGKLIACFYVTCLLFVVVALGGIARWHGFSLARFISYIRDEIFIVFGTSSSESVLPRIMEKLDALGVQRSVVGVVIPAGYSFNLDGTAIYLAIATVFIAQATGTPLGLTRQLTLLAILLITSKGAAGVAGAALVVLAATVSATGYLPVAGIALILGIHRFMGEAISVTNLIGNGVATIVVGKWCGQVNEARLAERLTSGPTVAPKPLDMMEAAS
jgi:aerobic C4-dicarboxylate transport protein